MKILGIVLGSLSLMAAILAFIPFLGLLNWVVVPFALVCFAISAFINSKIGRRLSGIALVVSIARLFLGGGFF